MQNLKFRIYLKQNHSSVKQQQKQEAKLTAISTPNPNPCSTRLSARTHFSLCEEPKFLGFSDRFFFFTALINP
jgi:hypothetical protein